MKEQDTSTTNTTAATTTKSKFEFVFLLKYCILMYIEFYKDWRLNSQAWCSSHVIASLQCKVLSNW